MHTLCCNACTHETRHHAYASRLRFPALAHQVIKPKLRQPTIGNDQLCPRRSLCFAFTQSRDLTGAHSAHAFLLFTNAHTEGANAALLKFSDLYLASDYTPRNGP